MLSCYIYMVVIDDVVVCKALLNFGCCYRCFPNSLYLDTRQFGPDGLAFGFNLRLEFSLSASPFSPHPQFDDRRQPSPSQLPAIFAHPPPSTATSLPTAALASPMIWSFSINLSTPSVLPTADNWDRSIHLCRPTLPDWAKHRLVQDEHQRQNSAMMIGNVKLKSNNLPVRRVPAWS